MPAFAACLTIADALWRDYLATATALRLYGPGVELNPLIRLVGPDPYFGTLLRLSAAHCDDRSPAWQLAAVLTWAVQTVALWTHQAAGTAVAGLPVLWWRW